MSAELVKNKKGDYSLVVNGKVTLNIRNWDDMGIFHNMDNFQIEAINILLQNTYFNAQTNRSKAIGKLLGVNK